MEQYLDRALVLRTLRYTTIQPPTDDSIIALTLQTARDRVEKLPVISLKNARPVAHWIYYHDDNMIECEECTADYKLSPYEDVTDFSYCPNCGNPMDVLNVKTPEERNYL